MNDADFQNPDQVPAYAGNFTVELVPGTSIDNLPSRTVSTYRKGDSVVVSVTSGRIRQDMAGLQLYDHLDTPFWWGYALIIAIRDQNGNPLWLNDKYRVPKK